MPTDSLIALVKKHEGVVATIYEDSLGYLTIGVGHLIDHRKGGWCDTGMAATLKARGYKLSEREIDALLANDLELAEAAVKELAGAAFATISRERYEALVSMAFNLGRNGLARFRKMWGAIHAGDWNNAANHALDSRWAEQVGKRATEIAETLKTGRVA